MDTIAMLIDISEKIPIRRSHGQLVSVMSKETFVKDFGYSDVGKIMSRYIYVN